MTHKFTLFFVFIFSISSLQANKILGDWYGALDFQGMQLRLVFHLTEKDDILQASMDSPDQGVLGIPVNEVSFKDQILNIRIPEIDLIYTGKVNDKFTLIDGTLTQRGVAFPMGLSRKEVEKKTMNRPQEPKGPFPYKEESVEVVNKIDEIKLAGTLSLPKTEKKHPVVILISGSGPQDRNEELLGHKPFLVLSDHLVRKGIGVLRMDDRGVGASGGDFSMATTEDFSRDVAAAVDYLKTRSDIDQKKIGLIGHSEGGMIAPMVASSSYDVSYIVLLAGPGTPIMDLMLSQSELISMADGKTKEDIDFNTNILTQSYQSIKKIDDVDLLKGELRAIYRTAMDKAPQEKLAALGDLNVFIENEVDQLTTPWFRYFIRFNPENYLKKVSCPVLAINGEKDLQVPVKENLAGIKNALEAAGNKNFVTKELPGLNHLFQPSKTGSPSEYAEIEETFSPIALNEISRWIQQQVR